MERESGWGWGVRERERERGGRGELVCGVCVCFAPGEAAARRRRLGPCAGWVPACLPTWRACVCAGCVFAFFSMCRTWEGGERAGGATRGWGPLHKNNSAAPACLCCVRERKGEVLSTKKAGSVPGKTRRDWGPHTHTGCAGAWGVGVQRGVERRGREGGEGGACVVSQPPTLSSFSFLGAGLPLLVPLLSLSSPRARPSHAHHAGLPARPAPGESVWLPCSAERPHAVVAGLGRARGEERGDGEPSRSFFFPVALPSQSRLLSRARHPPFRTPLQASVSSIVSTPLVARRVVVAAPRLVSRTVVVQATPAAAAAPAAVEGGDRMRLHNIAPQPGSRRPAKRKGRGHAAGQVRSVGRGWEEGWRGARVTWRRRTVARAPTAAAPAATHAAGRDACGRACAGPGHIRSRPHRGQDANVSWASLRPRRLAGRRSSPRRAPQRLPPHHAIPSHQKPTHHAATPPTLHSPPFRAPPAASACAVRSLGPAPASAPALKAARPPCTGACRSSRALRAACRRACPAL